MSTRPLSLEVESLDAALGARLLAARQIGTGGCWNWLRARNGSGYGITKVKGRKGWVDRVHRLAYAIWKGPVGQGLGVLHKCDNRACFNPEHLFLGTAADNRADMLQKGRGKQPRVSRGSACGTSKLTEVQVEKIIWLLLAGNTRTRIAMAFGVSMATISKIATGKNWSHLTAGRGIVKSTRGVRRLHV